MDLTKQTFIRWTILATSVLFAILFAAALLSYFGYLRLPNSALYTPVQIIGLAVATALPGIMGAAYMRGHEWITGVTILALNFLFPFFLIDEAFKYSIPQAIWIPFALALAICSTRWAILTFATTLAVLFAFFPITAVQYPFGAVVTMLIFIVLTLGKLLQESLTAKALAAEKAARDSEAALRKSEERYRAVFQHTVDAISVSRIADGTYLEANEAFFEMTGYHPDEIMGVSGGTQIIWEDPRKLNEMQHRLSQYGEVRNYEVCFKRKDGASFWGLTSSRVLDIDGIPCRISVTRDITEHKKADELINRLAYFDQLTQLPNRILFADRLQQTMAAQVQNGAFGALLLIDLDDFKILNDTRGHECGDLLLKQVAERLVCCAQPNDTVARFGGDEFAMMLADLGNIEKDAAAQAQAMAETVLAVLGQEFHLNAGIHRNTASIGICLFSGPEVGTETLLKQVELAMYQAKHAGRNLIRLFDPAMEVAIEKRAAMENDLRDALLEQQFVLHYQAQIAGTQLVGAEALVRWQHSQKGMVSPGEFIPLAEETGLIVSLGRWVLEDACSQLAKWGSDPKLEHLTMAVNVSVQQFHQADFVEQVLDVLRETGANPRRLKLELTESLLASNVNAIIEKMHTLKAKGIRFSLDDFGTGYSSLSYLKRLPIDQLKIDQAFVRDLLVNPDDIAIAKTIIKLGQNMGLGVIAEGVETAQHQAFLAELGCKVYQGYLYGRPMPIMDFEQRPEFLSLRG